MHVLNKWHKKLRLSVHTPQTQRTKSPRSKHRAMTGGQPSFVLAPRRMKTPFLSPHQESCVKTTKVRNITWWVKVMLPPEDPDSGRRLPTNSRKLKSEASIRRSFQSTSCLPQINKFSGLFVYACAHAHMYKRVCICEYECL